jgi:hypothetical protein
MKTRNLLLSVLAVVLVCSVFSIWFVPSLQDFMIGNSLWNGIKTTLKEIAGTPISSLEELHEDSTGAILISMPYLAYEPSDLEKVKVFINNGGTLFLLDDYGFGNEVLAYLGIAARFDGNMLMDPLFCYNDPSFPKITSFSSDFAEQNISQVILNHATVLNNVPVEYALAWSSPTSFIDTNGNEKQDKNEASASYAVAAKIRVGQGTLFLFSDPSILINSMISLYDNSKFVEDILKTKSDTTAVFFDASHLTKTPLDAAKSSLLEFRDFLAKPYPVLAVISIVFVIVYLLILRTGGSIGRQL